MCEPEEAAADVHDREPVPAVAQEELVEGAVELDVGGQRDRLRVHHVGDAQVLDPRHDSRLHLGRARALGQDHRDEHQPDAAAHGTLDGFVEAQRTDQVREPAAGGGHRPGRAVAVARAPPDDRAEHAPAVERQSRQQVEHEQQRVDEADVGDQRVPALPSRSWIVSDVPGTRWPRRSPRRSRSRSPRCSSVDQRPGDGDPEVHARRLRLLAHLRDPAEHPEVDPH